MEIDARALLSRWQVAVFGTGFQIAASVGLAFVIGWAFAWPWSRSLLLGFVLSLSSTAVVLKLLEDWGQMQTPLARDTLGILIVQDLAIIPMILVINAQAQTPQYTNTIWIAAIAMLGLVWWIARGKPISLPFAKSIRASHELQVFGALTICFGLAWASAAAGLSTALGAFAGGLIIGAARATNWVAHALEPFRVVFLGLFFVSVGLLLDLDFMA